VLTSGCAAGRAAGCAAGRAARHAAATAAGLELAVQLDRAPVLKESAVQQVNTHCYPLDGSSPCEYKFGLEVVKM